MFGKLYVTPGIYTFKCFWGGRLKIGTDAYKRLLGKGLDSPGCRVNRWDVPAIQQQQASTDPQAEQEQQQQQEQPEEPEEPEEEEEQDEIKRIRGGGPCYEDLSNTLCFHDGDAPLVPGEEDDDDDTDVVLVGVTNQCNKPLPVVKVEPNAKRVEAAEKKRKTEEEVASFLSKIKRKMEMEAAERKRKMEMKIKRKREEAAERKHKIEMEAAEKNCTIEELLEAARKKVVKDTKVEIEAAEKNCTMEELIEDARKKMIEGAKKKRKQQIEAANDWY